MSAYLTFLVHGQERKLHCGAIFTIGRDYSSDLALEDKAVSRHHAVIRQLGSGDYYVIDSGSANGTYVNGNRVTMPTRLNHGDRLSFGALEVAFISGQKPRRPYSLHDTWDDNLVRPKTINVPITILVSDLRDYTALAQNSSIQQLTGVMNEWFNAVADCVQGFRGTLDSFIGERVCARWKHDAGTDHSIIRALHTAYGIHQVTEQLGKKHPDLPGPLRVGVCINNGQVAVNPGQGRSTITEVANPVFRLEGVSKRLQKDIVMSQSAYENLPPRFWSGREQSVPVSGQKESVTVVGFNFDEISQVL